MKYILIYSVITLSAFAGLILTKAQNYVFQNQRDIQVVSNQNLPHSEGHSFETLDDYLAHLTKMGMRDRPFYEKVEENLYKLNTGRGARKPAQYFTRAQLMEKYGFQN